jgi:hypothetical protein
MLLLSLQAYSELRDGNVIIDSWIVAQAFNSYFLSSVNELIGYSSNSTCYVPLS